jgi:hypothetical protein
MHQIKRHGESRERRFIIQLGTCLGKRQSEHSAHLQGIEMSYRFNRQKKWEEGGKRYS